MHNQQAVRGKQENLLHEPREGHSHHVHRDVDRAVHDGYLSDRRDGNVNLLEDSVHQGGGNAHQFPREVLVSAHVSEERVVKVLDGQLVLLGAVRAKRAPRGGWGKIQSEEQNERLDQCVPRASHGFRGQHPSGPQRQAHGTQRAIHVDGGAHAPENGTPLVVGAQRAEVEVRAPSAVRAVAPGLHVDADGGLLRVQQAGGNDCRIALGQDQLGQPVVRLSGE